MAIIRERQLIYEEIKKLTEQIGKLSLTTALEDASSKNTPITKDEAEKLIEISIKESPEMFNLSEFIQMYRANGSQKIFGDGEDFYQYDPKDIDPLNLVILFILTYGKVTDTDIFCGYLDFCKKSEEFGYINIAKFLRNNELGQVAPVHNIMKIFS